MDTLALEEFNQKIFDSLIKVNNHLQLGFFNSDLILFIGQNPGRPFTIDQQQEIENLRVFKNYAYHESAYTEEWKKSLFGNFIGKVINDKWDKISFTNLVKIPTPDNETPGLSLLVQFGPILEQQISLLQPKLIVCLGRFVGSLYHLDDFYRFERSTYGGVVMFPHPAYVQRQGWMQVEEEARKQRQLINNYIVKNSLFT